MATAKKTTNTTSAELTAKRFIEDVKLLQDDKELEKIKKYFKTGQGEYGDGDQFIGVRMGHLFDLAKKYMEMPVVEIEKLLENKIHEVRAGACSIMDKAGRNHKTAEGKRKELFDLYIRRHDRINNWDLVDLAAPYVVGRFLFDKPRTLLGKLAKSKQVWERRTAIVSTSYFIRQGQIEDTFDIAGLLVRDPHDLVQKAVGGWIREAGKQDQKRLTLFLDEYVEIMPRTMLRYAIEKLSPKQREDYMTR